MRSMFWFVAASTILLTIQMDTRCAYSQSIDLSGEWTSHSAREEIKPIFQVERDPRSLKIEGGDAKQTHSDDFLIKADHREGLAGYWLRETAITGGQWYQFRVDRNTSGMSLPRRSAIARLIWVDQDGKAVLRPAPTYTSYRPGERPRAEPDFPSVISTDADWSKLGGVYRAPEDATSLRIELHFRWGEPRSQVHWRNPSLIRIEGKPERRVRLATIHYQPRDGKSPKEKREQFAPFIRSAHQQRADLVVLPETLTYYATGKTFADVAETIPGPSTDYFGELAKQFNLYLVAGLVERDQHLLYNVAVLIGPDGKVVGKYRKTTLPRGEIEAGLTPGSQYPVFETRFGKVGMMICYDGFFPEVARELTNRGAEVIAWPVWGCNPLLAAARACENHVYLISSTYTESNRNWIRSAVYGHDGQAIVAADDFGSVVVTEVDLAEPTYWHSLGDFQSQIQPHRPLLESPSP